MDSVGIEQYLLIVIRTFYTVGGEKFDTVFVVDHGKCFFSVELLVFVHAVSDGFDFFQTIFGYNGILGMLHKIVQYDPV